MLFDSNVNGCIEDCSSVTTVAYYACLVVLDEIGGTISPVVVRWSVPEGIKKQNSWLRVGVVVVSPEYHYDITPTSDSGPMTDDDSS